MKILSGAELVGYIKVRQAKQVRALRQAHHVKPRLAIIQTADQPVIDTYVRLKQAYGEDILIEVVIHKIDQQEIMSVIDRLNNDDAVHAIIVQLPLADTSQTNEVLQAVSPAKDVDGLGKKPSFDSATALAINWLCAGYNINLSDQKILIIGQGRLVGQPLTRMWRASGYDVTVADRHTENIKELSLRSSLIVSGAGSPGLLTSDMVSPDTIIIDAGTASEGGKIIGDVADEIYQRQDIAITPRKGGVGPLTVSALFDNVIRSAMASTKQS